VEISWKQRLCWKSVAGEERGLAGNVVPLRAFGVVVTGARTPALSKHPQAPAAHAEMRGSGLRSLVRELLQEQAQRSAVATPAQDRIHRTNSLLVWYNLI